MWKIIPQYPNYMVSENGDVFSLNSKKVLRPSKSNGYYKVLLIKDGGRHHLLVHRLVADVFVKNPHNLPCVNHKDENKYNNNASNLEWCTYQYNNIYRNRHLKAGKKLRKAVSQFDGDGKLVRTYDSAMIASKETGMREQSIARAARGERKTYNGYLWSWVDQEDPQKINHGGKL